MMICGDSFSALGLLFIFIYIQTGHAGVLPILIGVAISSIFLALLEPAYKATITDLLSEEDYAKASGLVQIAAASKYLISPFIAGLILSVADISAILLIDMATFFVAVFAITSVRKSIKTDKPNKSNFNFFKDFREGMKSITSDKGVSSLVLLMAFMCFFIAFLQTLMTPMILAFADAKTLGIMESVSAVGMLIGSVIIGVFMAMIGTTTNKLLIGYLMMYREGHGE